MRFKKAITAALGISMVATPVLAQSAAPLSIAASGRVGAAVGGSSLIGSVEEDNLLLPGAALLIILAAAIILSKGDDSTDFGNPQSP